MGVARGTGGGRSLLLNAHMDTVGVAGMDRPFEPASQTDKLHGRGAGDMKGSLAAIMLVGRAAAAGAFRGDVIVAAVADEEVGSVGTEELVRRTPADAAIVTEPTEEVVAVAHKGFVAFEVAIRGYAAHGSRPDLGVDAIAAMGPVLSGIAALDRRLRAGAGHPLLGTGSIHASVIEGGQEYSSYPASCRLQGERRTIPGESVAAVRAELDGLVAGTRRGRRASRSIASRSRPRPTRRSCGRCSRTSARRRSAGSPSGPTPRSSQPRGSRPWSSGPPSAGSTARTSGFDLASLARCHDAYLAVAADLCA